MLNKTTEQNVKALHTGAYAILLSLFAFLTFSQTASAVGELTVTLEYDLSTVLTLTEDGNDIHYINWAKYNEDSTSSIFTLNTNPTTGLTLTSALVLKTGAVITCGDNDYTSTTSLTTGALRSRYDTDVPANRSLYALPYIYCVKAVDSSENSATAQKEIVAAFRQPITTGTELTRDSGIPGDLITNDGSFTATVPADAASLEFKIYRTDPENPRSFSVDPQVSLILPSSEFTESGVYNVNARFKDKYGNPGDTSTVTEFTLDIDVPAEPILDIDTSAKTITVGGLETDAISKEYKIDSGEYLDIPDTGVISISNLNEGQIYTISARQTDIAGNDSLETSLGFSIEDQPTITYNPNVIFEKEGLFYLNKTGADVSPGEGLFTAVANGTTLSYFKGRASTNCSSLRISSYNLAEIPTNQDSTFTANRQHKICIRAQGAIDFFHTSFLFEVDTELPDLTVLPNNDVIQVIDDINYLAEKYLDLSPSKPLAQGSSTGDSILYVSESFSYPDVNRAAVEVCEDFRYIDNVTKSLSTARVKQRLQFVTGISQERFGCFKAVDTAGNEVFEAFPYTIVLRPEVQIINAGFDASNNKGYISKADSLKPLTFKTYQTDADIGDEKFACNSSSLSYVGYTSPEIIYNSNSNQICFQAEDFLGSIGYANSKDAEDIDISTLALENEVGDKAAGREVDGIRYTKDTEVVFTGEAVPGATVSVYIETSAEANVWASSQLISATADSNGAFKTEQVTLSNGDYDIGASTTLPGSTSASDIAKVLDLRVDTTPAQDITLIPNDDVFLTNTKNGEKKYYLNKNSYSIEGVFISTEPPLPETTSHTFGYLLLPSDVAYLADTSCASDSLNQLISRPDNMNSSDTINYVPKETEITHLSLRRSLLENGGAINLLPGRYAVCFKSETNAGSAIYKAFNFTYDNSTPNPSTATLKNDTEDSGDNITTDATVSISNLDTTDDNQWAYGVYTKKATLNLLPSTTSVLSGGKFTFTFPATDQDASLIKEGGKLFVRVKKDAELLGSMEFSTTAGYGVNLDETNKGSLLSERDSDILQTEANYGEVRIKGVYFSGDNIIISISGKTGTLLSSYKSIGLTFEVFYGHLTGSEYTPTLSGTSEILADSDFDAGEKFVVVKQKDFINNTTSTILEFVLTLGDLQVPTLSSALVDYFKPIIRLIGKAGNFFAIKSVAGGVEKDISWVDTDTAAPVSITTDSATPYYARGRCGVCVYPTDIFLNTSCYRFYCKKVSCFTDKADYRFKVIH